MAKKRQSNISGKCQATARGGNSCAAPPIRGKRFCSFHAEPGRAAQLGRQGGRKKSYPRLEPPNEYIIAPNGATEIFERLGTAFVAVQSGQMDPKVGATLAFMAGQLLKAYEVMIQEGRLMKLEASVSEVSESARRLASLPTNVTIERPPDEEFDKAVSDHFGKRPAASC